MSELSAKQRQILEYMKAEVREKGYPPSVREICDAVGLKSTSTVHGHLSRLEKKGLIRRDPTKPRAIEILDSDFDAPQREFVNVPIVGQYHRRHPDSCCGKYRGYLPDSRGLYSQ